jgi:hypothetical protein
MHAVDGKPDTACCQAFNEVSLHLGKHHTWNRYNRKGNLLCFDWSEDEFHEKLALAQRQLGLPALLADDRFYDSMLKNYQSNDLSIIPGKYRTLSKNLRAITL